MISRLILVLLLAVSLTGCSLRMNQLETARRFLPTSADPRLADYAWELKFNGASYLVYPIDARGRQVVFANGNGLRLTWDGESIILLEGVPGAFGRYESGVEDDGRERWYAQAGLPIARAACTPRREWRLTQTRSGWRQECVSAPDQKSLLAQHLVELDGQGNITLIEASIRPGATRFMLSRQRR